MTINRCCTALALAAMAFGVVKPVSAKEFSHKIDTTIQLAYANNGGEQSFLNGGVSPFRYDEAQTRLYLNQASLTYRAEWGSAFSLTADALFYDDLGHDISLSQLYLRYAPLPQGKLRWRARAGYFFPSMSLENTRPGWLNRYGISHSAINSWYGEALRSAGAEISVTRPGRRYNSPYTVTGVAGAFRANDGLGTLLAFRGWSLHDRISGLGERIPMANYAGFNASTPLVRQTRNVDTGDEIDGRWGGYIGAHVRYLSRWQARIYYFDNNADPHAFSEGQWAWDTRFTQVSARYNINRQWHFTGQYLSGDTLAGNNLVSLDYESFNLGLHYQHQTISAGVRYDDFETQDTDNTPVDNNSGDGTAFTGYVSYALSNHLTITGEITEFNSDRQNRIAITGTQAFDDTQFVLAATYRFRSR